MSHSHEYGPRSVASRAVFTAVGRIYGRGLPRSVSYFYYPLSIKKQTHKLINKQTKLSKTKQNKCPARRRASRSYLHTYAGSRRVRVLNNSPTSKRTTLNFADEMKVFRSEYSQPAIIRSTHIRRVVTWDIKPLITAQMSNMLPTRPSLPL